MGNVLQHATQPDAHQAMIPDEAVEVIDENEDPAVAILEGDDDLPEIPPNVYEVDKISDHEVEDNKLLYFVHWKKDDLDTYDPEWLYEDQLNCPDVILKYWTRTRKRNTIPSIYELKQKARLRIQWQLKNDDSDDDFSDSSDNNDDSDDSDYV